MSIAYKPDQGYWTRMMSGIGGLMVAAAGAAWIFGQLSKFASGDNRSTIIYWQGGSAAVIVIGAVVFFYWLIYVKPRTSEFLIATEGEMKKVNWSTKREIYGSTWVVIFVAIFLSVLLFIVDALFSLFFKWIGVLQIG
ncbi:MAG: preprotein translocase subunit SecE [Phycisphaerales bacterium]|nr:preprotein translocase subunit SecE [Phycisphaerales bacterium]